MTTPIIISFPRSGSNFFADYFESRTGIDIKLEHTPVNTPNTVSCIRNPIDTISSLVTMNHDSVMSRLGHRISDQDLMSYVRHRTKQATMLYVGFYEFLQTSNNIIIDYESFSSDIDNAVAIVADRLGVKLLSENLPIQLPADDIKNGYLVGSKGQDSYQKCLEVVNELITDESMEIFAKVKEMSCLL